MVKSRKTQLKEESDANPGTTVVAQMADLNGWSVWKTLTIGTGARMPPPFYQDDNNSGGEDKLNEHSVNEMDAQPEEDELRPDDSDSDPTAKESAENERVVLRFKQGLKEAEKDKAAKNEWLARNAKSICTTCKKKPDACQRRDGKVGCIPCRAARRRCSMTKGYIMEYAARRANVAGERAGVLFETYGKTRRTATRSRKRVVKVEAEADENADRGALGAIEEDTKAKAKEKEKTRAKRAKKTTTEFQSSARVDSPAHMGSSPAKPVTTVSREPHPLVASTLNPSSETRFVPTSMMRSPLLTGEHLDMSLFPKASSATLAREASKRLGTRVQNITPAMTSSTHPVPHFEAFSQLRGDSRRDLNAQYNNLRDNYEKLGKDKATLTARAHKLENENRQLKEEVKDLVRCHKEVLELRAEIAKIKSEQGQNEGGAADREIAWPNSEGNKDNQDAVERIKSLERYITTQQRNHMRLSARVGQVELMLRRLVCPRDASSVFENKDTLLEMALEELSSCLHDDMGSRMEYWNGNPLSNSAVVFKPEIIHMRPSQMAVDCAGDADRETDMQEQERHERRTRRLGSMRENHDEPMVLPGKASGSRKRKSRE
ncbi:hypothetical protein D9615_008706 [Tricholomella constricta]|uniref:Uncharacterized protein n=1 Tax=Tricholomella constricta TaxID=117010 RepID=A0A8H5M2M3_9AGAR|nr:hypothetical protein D9615_008706 [Tricholomella constricta]